jgi:glycosyltransferase involved in cell wall biosynthesis
MNKITILGITNGRSTGVAFYRMQLPLNYLLKNNSDEFDLICLSSNEVDITSKALDNVMIVHLHANITRDTALMQKLLLMQKNGCKLVMDLDDYFVVPASNPHAKTYNETVSQNIVKYISKMDYLTTTTKLYANELKKYNKNVFVLPNVIDNDISQFNQPHIKSDRIRIGLVGGISHIKDIEHLEGMVEQLEKYKDKIQFVLCGFDLSGVEYPEFSLWNEFERVLTNNYSIISQEYKDWLFTYSKDEYPNVENERYRRVWGKDINSFGELYKSIDVLLAPLENTLFNRCKSELKVIEAGNFGKIFIGSKVGQYAEIITDGYDGLLVPPYSKTGWAKAIERIFTIDGYGNMLQRNCFALNQRKYNIKNWNSKRVNFYKKLIK